MLGRFILGGVALAATGFGLKRYFDNSGSVNIYHTSSNDDNLTNAEKVVQKIILAELKEMIKMFEDEREKLTNTTLLELNKALGEIQNLPTEIKLSKVMRTKYPFIKADEKITEEIQNYTALLIQMEIFINDNFYALDKLITHSNDFKTYSNEDKELINNLIQLSTLLNKINDSQMTYDKQFVSREYKRAFNQLKEIVK